MATEEEGTVIHRSDVSTVPPMFQPAWKASPAKGRDRLSAIGGDMFSPIKLQQMFLSPAHDARPESTAFTFRAERPAASSTPLVQKEPRRGSNHGPPSTPGGPHVPLRLFNLQYDARVRSGLEQLVEERDVHGDASQITDASTLQNMRHNKRLRRHSREYTPGTPAQWHAPHDEPKQQRIPLSYRSTNTESPAVPRSILKSGPERLGRTPSRASTDTPRRAASEVDHSALSQASFRVTRERLVELLTDVAPWEPDWALLKQVDLRARRLESCIGLDEYLPSLEEAWLDHNRVAFATGLPPSLKILTASSNCFSELASFAHLRRLEVLDVSANELTSLAALADLPNLVELRAARNQITRLHGLERLTRLVHLDLRDNMLGGRLDFGAMHWPRMAYVRLARNTLTEVEGLATLPRLDTLDVEDNALTHLVLPTPQLHTLRVSGNASLHRLDVALAPRIRTLYADRCSLASVHGLRDAYMLQRFSLRQQHVRIRTPLANPESLERLFLSGNALSSAEVLRTETPGLVYLELAGCQLMELPTRLAHQTPSLRTLNLDHNHLVALPALPAWTRLKRLSAVGCRIPTLEAIVHGVDGHSTLCVLDVRMNPCTLGLYPPVLIPVGPAQGEDEVLPPVPHPAIVQPDTEAALDAALSAEHAAAQALADRSQFHKRAMLLPPKPHDEVREYTGRRAAALFAAADERFVATLPSPIARKRVVYRGLCGMACATLTWLDGIELVDADVACAERDLARVCS